MVDSEVPAARNFSPNAVHLLRTVQQNHVQLSAMADHKASILMGATFVIFAVSVGQMRTGPASPPLMILAVAAFLSSVCAILAVLPAVRYRRLGSDNLLFFGSFAQMTEEEHSTALLARLETDEQIYRTMLHDLYQNGVVLERKKYRLLGYAYRVMLIGLVGSFVVLAIGLAELS